MYENKRNTYQYNARVPVRNGNGTITSCGIPSRITWNEIAPGIYVAVVDLYIHPKKRNKNKGKKRAEQGNKRGKRKRKGSRQT